MVELVLTFTENVENTPKAIPHYRYLLNNIDSVRWDAYDRIMQYTGNHELAEDVTSWAEIATVGEVYECDELTAELVED